MSISDQIPLHFFLFFVAWSEITHTVVHLRLHISTNHSCWTWHCRYFIIFPFLRSYERVFFTSNNKDIEKYFRIRAALWPSHILHLKYRVLYSTVLHVRTQQYSTVVLYTVRKMNESFSVNPVLRSENVFSSNLVVG